MSETGGIYEKNNWGNPSEAVLVKVMDRLDRLENRRKPRAGGVSERDIANQQARIPVHCAMHPGQPPGLQRHVQDAIVCEEGISEKRRAR